MTLIFWQNIISPHQLPYIKALSSLENHLNVVLVAPKMMDSKRAKMGWGVAERATNNQFKIILNPEEEEIKNIFIHYSNAKHFFSGIRATPFVFKAFRLSLSHDLKRYLIVEGPTYYNRPKIIHLFKTFVFDRKYFKHIHKVFAIGKDAYEWYKFWGFPASHIIPFAYCVENVKVHASQRDSENSTVKLIYVGSLTRLKGIDKLLDEILQLPYCVNLDIVGNGKLLANLKRLIKLNKGGAQVRFIETMPNRKVRELMTEYDCLILPSRYDGWGAVVNEGLMAGLFVICSENCGAKELIHENFNGKIFSHTKHNDLADSLQYCFQNIDDIRGRREAIKSWSKCIEAETIGQYFLDTFQDERKPTPPWKVVC